MDDTERQIQFTQRFSECERAMRAFAYSLIPNRGDVAAVGGVDALKDLVSSSDEGALVATLDDYFGGSDWAEVGG